MYVAHLAFAFLAFTFAAFVYFIFAAALSKFGEGLRTKDVPFSEKEIFKAKARRILGLLPFVLIIGYGTAQFFPENISIRSVLHGKKLSEDVPSNETEFRDEVVYANSEIDKAEMAERITGYDIQTNLRDGRRLYQEHARAKTIEKKSELEDQAKRVSKDYNENQAKLAGIKKSIINWKAKLEIARSDLLAFRDGKPTSFDRAREEAERLSGENIINLHTEKFMWYSVFLLALLLPLSYLLINFVKSKNEELNLMQSLVALTEEISQSVADIGFIPFKYFLKIFNFNSPPVEVKNLRQNVMKIGHEEEAFLTDKNLNYHTQVIGGSGAGKTNFLKVILEDRIAKNHAIIFFDFKGEVDLVDWMAGATTHYGRRNDMAMISMSDPKTSYAYNPISLGTETEISSQIMNAFTWSESFYKNSAENALLIILKAFCYQRDLTRKTFHLGDLYRFLIDPSFRMDMVSAVSLLNYSEMFRGDLQRICEELSTNKKENYLSLITQISKILNSSAGEVVAHKIGNDEELNLKQAMSSGKITYFMMNNLKLKETAAIMGKMILQDLMKTVGNIYDDRNHKRNPVTLIIDEFASFATPDFGEFIEKARGAGISIVVTYQSRKSLDHIEQGLALKINENTANKVVFQLQDSEDVEWFCKLMGTKTTIKETYQVEDDYKTGAKSMREVEEYVIHPNEIKKLKLGQALLYCSKVDPHFGIMNILKANDFEGRYERISALVENFEMPETINAWPVNQKNNNGVQYDDLV